MAEKYFLGGMTPNGFSTQIGEFLTDDQYFTYLIKGGAGTGKSTLMKKLADRFEDTEPVTRFYCSSDPDSLDAVQLHFSKVLICDATAPHTLDPRYPGVRQKIVDLGSLWNEHKLREHADEILQASDENKLLLDCAAKRAKALGNVCESSFEIGEYCLDRPKLEAFAMRLCRKLFGKKQTTTGKRTVRQLSALTRYGYLTFTETLENCLDVFMLSDDLFSPTHRLLELVAQQARRLGFDVTLSPCLLFGREVWEHLLIPKLGIALVSSSQLTSLDIAGAVKINMSRFCDKQKAAGFKKHIRLNDRLIGELLKLSSQTMDSAKLVHDRLESCYIEAMDFGAVDMVCDRLTKQISEKSR